MSIPNINQLQQQIQSLNDQITDIFHASELNFSAIKIHLQLNNNTKQYQNNNNIIHQCQKQFTKLIKQFQTRTTLRLQYLINQQIKLQQQKVRRQRLLQYQDKIYDHRRLICDKQAFYDSLIKPKYRKPVGMTIEQFQQKRHMEIQLEEKKNHQQLEEQTQILVKIEKMVRNFRVGLEEQYNQYKKQVERIETIKNKINNKKNKNKQSQYIKNQQQQQQQLQSQQSQQLEQLQLQQEQEQIEHVQLQDKKAQLQHNFNPNPKLQLKSKQNQLLQSFQTKLALYQTVDISNKPFSSLSLKSLNQSRKLLSELFKIQQNASQLMKQYKQQQQMYKYLRWQQKQLIQKYKKIQNQIKDIKNLQKQKINQQKKFQRNKSK